MKKFAALLAVVLLVVSFVSISAQEKAPCSSTAVDSETKVKFQKLKLQYELDMVDLNAEKDGLHKSLMTELLSEETSKKNIDKIAKSINTNQGKMLKAKMSYLLKVKDVLPADHYKKFLMKGHGCAPGCKKPCCSTKASGCKSSCSSHGASKCSKAGTDGHTWTSACTSASAGCETPCDVKVSK
jgi:hypothetical protein